MPDKAVVSYTASKKKMLLYGGVWFLSSIGVVWVAQHNQRNLLLILAILVVFTGIVLVQLRRTAKDAKCSNCDAQIFEVIQAAEGSKISFNYCPQCGSELTI